MDISVTRSEGSLAHIKVVFTQEEWQKAQRKVFLKLAKDVEVAGFRKGHVPEEKARQIIDPRKVLDEARNTLIRDAYIKALDENQIDPIENATVTDEKMTETELEVTLTVTTRPEVVLGQYMGLKVTQEPILVTDDDVDHELSHLQQDNAQFEVKEEGEVANGNIVIIDFEGSVDGVPFEGGKAEGYELEIGSNSFIPGFEEQLIGMKKDEEKDINVTFPENYTPTLASKAAVFKIKLHEIKEKHLPELDDNFALDVNKEGVSTLDQLKESLREEIRSKKKVESENKALNQLMKLINDGSQVDIPATIIDENVEHELEHFKERVQQAGMTYEQYLEMSKVTEESIKKDIRESLKDRIKLSFVLGKIGSENKITVSEEEIDQELQTMANTYSMELEAVKKALKDRMVELANDLFMRKVEAFIKANNDIA